MQATGRAISAHESLMTYFYCTNHLTFVQRKKKPKFLLHELLQQKGLLSACVQSRDLTVPVYSSENS